MTPECKNCGAFVTKDFARVFGGNDGEVYGCLECETATDMKRGTGRSADAVPAGM